MHNALQCCGVIEKEYRETIITYCPLLVPSSCHLLSIFSPTAYQKTKKQKYKEIIRSRIRRIKRGFVVIKFVFMYSGNSSFRCQHIQVTILFCCYIYIYIYMNVIENVLWFHFTLHFALWFIYNYH